MQTPREFRGFVKFAALWLSNKRTCYSCVLGMSNSLEGNTDIFSIKSDSPSHATSLYFLPLKHGRDACCGENTIASSSSIVSYEGLRTRLPSSLFLFNQSFSSLLRAPSPGGIRPG